VYEGRDVGRMIDTSEATVVSSRIVNIKEESKGYGPLAGAAVGATGTGLASRGSGNAGWLIALGGLVGAGAGLLAEQAGRSREGIEYLVRTSDGRVMTLVQNRGASETPIPAGKAVLVQHSGSYTRVIEKPETLEDEWRNPDRSGGGGAGTGGDVQQRSGTPAGSDPNRRTQGGAGSSDPLANRARPPAAGGGATNGQDDQ
jgi:outer membrane lipoprotein SlyB